MVARAWLDNPNWALDAAKKLGLADPLTVLPAAYAHWLKTFAPPVRGQK